MGAAEVLQSYLEAFNHGDIDAIAALYAESTSYWNPFTPQPVTSPREVREFETPMFAAFVNVVAELEEAILDGDRGAARIVVRAVHTGDLATPGGAIPATGKEIELHSAEFIRLDDDDTSSSTIACSTPPRSCPSSAWRERFAGRPGRRRPSTRAMITRTAPASPAAGLIGEVAAEGVSGT